MSEQTKQNTSTIQWAIRGVAGVAFTLLAVLYHNEREARMDLVDNLKEVSQEMSSIEDDFKDFQRNVIKDYVTRSDFKELNETLLDLNSNISEVVERLIKLETRIEGFKQ